MHNCSIITFKEHYTMAEIVVCGCTQSKSSFFCGKTVSSERMSLAAIKMMQTLCCYM
jgi:hypothetical protein